MSFNTNIYTIISPVIIIQSYHHLVWLQLENLQRLQRKEQSERGMTSKCLYRWCVGGCLWVMIHKREE